MIQFFIFFLLFPHVLNAQAVAVEYQKPAYETTFGQPSYQQSHNPIGQLSAAVKTYSASWGLSHKDRAFYTNKSLQSYMIAIVSNLIALNNGNKIERVRAFNTLAYNNHPSEYKAMNSALLKVLQGKCNNEGKLVSLDRDPYLTAYIYKALKETLPHKIYLEVLKLLNDKTSTEILEAETSIIFGYWWNMFWEKLNRWLNYASKRASCTWSQITQHAFNKKLKELLHYVDTKQYFAAQQHAQQDPLLQEIFSASCPQFIREQRTMQAVASEQVINLTELKDEVAQPFDDIIPEAIRICRNESIDIALTDPSFFRQQCSLTAQGEKLLQKIGINPNNFKMCYGNHVQQALHKEHLQIIDSSAGIYFIPQQQQNIKDIVEHTVHFVNVARQYNQAGYLQKATSVSDCCWAFLDCAASITKGLGKGALKGTTNFIDYALDHPIETLARPIAGNFILAYRLGQLTAQLADVARIGVSTLAGNESALQEWEQLCSNVTGVKNALHEKCKNMSLEECVTEITAFATEAVLDYKCAKTLHKFYQTGERKTLDLVDKMRTNLPPPPLHAVALTPEGFEIGIATQAAAIATGEVNSVLRKLEQFGGGTSLFASIEKIASPKNEKANNYRSQPNGRYEDASYHTKLGNTQKSKRPIDGQKALDNSISFSKNTERRVGISNNEFVVLDKTSENLYHGHVRTWEQLTDKMQRALKKIKMVNSRGKILSK